MPALQAGLALDIPSLPPAWAEATPRRGVMKADDPCGRLPGARRGHASHGGGLARRRGVRAWVVEGPGVWVSGTLRLGRPRQSVRWQLVGAPRIPERPPRSQRPEEVHLGYDLQSDTAAPFAAVAESARELVRSAADTRAGRPSRAWRRSTIQTRGVWCIPATLHAPGRCFSIGSEVSQPDARTEGESVMLLVRSPVAAAALSADSTTPISSRHRREQPESGSATEPADETRPTATSNRTPGARRRVRGESPVWSG